MEASALRIRLARRTDGDALASIYAPAVALPTSFEIDAPDGAEMARRVGKIVERTPWLVAEREGDVVGYAYASPHRDRPAYQWSVETSAYVRADQHRLGIARLLYSALFRVLHAQGFVNAFAGVTLPNDASIALHSALGFTPVGVYRGVGYKAGAWHDVAWFERPLVPRPMHPPPPRALASLPNEELEELLSDARHG